ncbi:MAG: KamA family radical SAM protein [Candidatus Aceula meridiana]|nr:KamA family radical SAM protein [Candidatus Aceula meridiana]
MKPIEEITNQTSQEQENISSEKNASLRVNLSSKENRVINSFENATPFDWEDWAWQLRNSIKDKETLSQIVNLTEDEIAGIDKSGQKLTMSIPPYFSSLIDPNDPNCPIRRQCIPLRQELIRSDHELEDPCGEDSHSPVYGLVHRYPDRVLFLVSEMCAMYCRHCTRSRMVAKGKRKLKASSYEAAYEYIRSNKKIRDVLISGGDPLILSDHILEEIIKNIRAIPHVEFIRIGTRMPVTLPQRITAEFVAMLKKYGPIWMSIHFNHPKEITKRVKFACELLADNGIPLGSQTVLLKGINDKPYIMKKLMQELLKIRVRPYYIYQCDPIAGSSHFRTPLSVGINIIDKLRGHTTGYAVPKYVVDLPGGGGKVPIEPNGIIRQEKGCYTIKNFAGQEYDHHDPV